MPTGSYGSRTYNSRYVCNFELLYIIIYSGFGAIPLLSPRRALQYSLAVMLSTVGKKHAFIAWDTPLTCASMRKNTYFSVYPRQSIGENRGYSS